MLFCGFFVGGGVRVCYVDCVSEILIILEDPYMAAPNPPIDMPAEVSCN